MSNAKIIRAPRDKQHRWKTVNITAAEDPRLSWEARGLAFYLLAKPDDWEIYPSDLIKKGIAGKDMVYRMLKELELAGYLERQRVRDEFGRMSGVQSLFHETPLHMNEFDRPERKRTAPHTESPDTDNPDAVCPDAENPHTTKKELPPRINHHEESITTMGQSESTAPQPAPTPVGGGGQKSKKQPKPAPEQPNRTETFIWLAEAEDGPRLGDLGTLNRCAHLPLTAVQAEWARVKAQGKGGGWLVKVITAPAWRADVPPPVDDLTQRIAEAEARYRAATDRTSRVAASSDLRDLRALRGRRSQIQGRAA